MMNEHLADSALTAAGGCAISSQNEMHERRLIGSDGLIVRDSGIWAKEKLYYLERYLDIFSVGMKRKWPGRLYYVDPFAGPGKCRIRDTGEEIDGSPLIALKFDFSKYFFFETDAISYKALTLRVKTRAPEKQVSVIHGDCNALIHQVNPLRESLGLAFIDPTGVAPVYFETIRRLTRNRRLDLIVNFHEGMGVRMNIHQYTNRERGALDAFLGSDRWRQKFRTAPSSIDQVCREIVDEYRENLRSLGYQVIDGEQIPVRTDRNVLLYYLLFASKDARGNDFWRKIGLIGPHGQRKLGF